MNGWSFYSYSPDRDVGLIHCNNYEKVFINLETLIPYCSICGSNCPEDFLTQAKLVNAWVYDELCRDIFYTGEGIWR